MIAVLQPKQIEWCKSHLRGFVDDDGKTRLEKFNEWDKQRRDKINELKGNKNG